MEGHIAGAKDVDFLDNGFEQKVAALDRKQAFVVHCASGGRSSSSLALLKKLGFASVYHLGAGFGACEATGKPVAK